MIFKALEISNFLSMGEGSRFDFDSGLVLITGSNLDTPKASSNGAGKSTLLEAMVWCLWGETIRGLKADEVVNEQVGKNCKVKLFLEDDNVNYEIVRYRKCKQDKPNDLRVFSGGKELTQGSMSLTQKKIDSIIGMDLHTFCAMMPGAGVKVASLTDKEVKKLLESILRTEEVALAHAIAVERRKKVREQLETAKLENSFSKQKRDEITERIRKYKESHDNFDSNKRGRVDSLQAKLDIKLSRKEDVEKELKELSKGLSLKGFLLGKQALFLGKKAAYEYCRSCSISKYEEAQISYRSKKLSLEDKLGKEKEHLESNRGQERCPLCFQACSEKDLVEARTQNIERIEESLRVLTAPSKNEYNGFDEGYFKVLEEIKLINKKFDLLKQAGTNKIYKKKERSSILASLKELEEEIESVVAEDNPFEELLVQEKKELSNIKKLVKISNKRVKDLEEEENRLSFWVEGFSPQGLRSYMLTTVVPVLNKRADHYCSLLTNNELSIKFNTQTTLKSGKVAEKFSIDVDYNHGASSWKGASSGEKARVDLIVALCLGDLAAMRSRKKLSFRFMDEPFENIDEAGVEAVSALLHQQINEYPSIYVITHNSAFAQMFSKTINLTKKNGITRITKQ